MKEYLSRLNVDSLLTDSGLTFLLRIAAAAVAYGTFIILARLLQPAELGHFVFAQSALWILMDLATLGLGFAATRFIPKATVTGMLEQVTGYIQFTQRTVFLSATLIAMIIALALKVLLDPQGGEREGLLLILCVGLPFGALTAANTYVSRSFNWFLFASSVGVTLRPVLFFLSLMGLHLLVDLKGQSMQVAWLLVMSLIVVAVLQKVLLRLRVRALQLPKTGEQKRRIWISTALTLLFATVFTNYFVDVHVVITGFFLPSDDLAIFNAALRTLAIIGFGSAAIGIAVSPRVSALHAQGDVRGINSLARTASALTLVASLAGVSALAIFGERILGFFGPEYVNGYTALLIASAAQVIVGVSTVLVPLVAMTGHHLQLIKGLAILLPPIVAFHALLIAHYAMLGASVAFVISAGLWAAWVYWLAHQRVGLRLLSVI